MDFYRRLDERTAIGPGVRKILETPLVYGDCGESLPHEPDYGAVLMEEVRPSREQELK